MKTFFSRLAIIFVAALMFAPNVFAIVKPTEKFYVNDYADLLSDETEAFIMDSNLSLNQATGAQIVVVTVPNLEGRELEDYSLELARSFAAGDAEKNNGVVMLLALEERQSRIEVGRGLEGRLTDGKTGRIQDEYMIPFYKDDNFDAGMLNGFKAVYAEVAAEYNFDTNIQGEAQATADEDDTFATLFGAKLMAALFVLSIDRRKLYKKIISFVALEIMTVIASFAASKIGFSPIVVLIIGTIVNFCVSWFLDEPARGTGRGGHYHSGGWSSGGGSSGGFSGGGGSFGGGGSSRSF